MYRQYCASLSLISQGLFGQCLLALSKLKCLLYVYILTAFMAPTLYNNIWHSVFLEVEVQWGLVTSATLKMSEDN